MSRSAFPVKTPLGADQASILCEQLMLRITDHPNMTSADYHGHKATNQTNKKSLCTSHL